MNPHTRAISDLGTEPRFGRVSMTTFGQISPRFMKGGDEDVFFGPNSEANLKRDTQNAGVDPSIMGGLGFVPKSNPHSRWGTVWVWVTKDWRNVLTNRGMKDIAAHHAAGPAGTNEDTMKDMSTEALVEAVVGGAKPEVLLERALNEGGFVIGAHGLEKPKTGILIQPDHEYFMGASSSPSHIVVTGVAGDMITYRQYPYTKDLRVQKWIGTDLIMTGTQTWLKSGRGAHHPELERSLQNLMAGKPSNMTVHAEDFRPIEVQVKPKSPTMTVDKLWYEVERTPPHYSSRSSMKLPDGSEVLEIGAQYGDLAALKADHRFHFVKFEFDKHPEDY